jgi:uncharacterized protein
MAQLQDQYARPVAGTRTQADIDEGLRSHMLGVYNYMTLGIAFTGLMAYAMTFLTTTTDPSLAVATMRNGTMLTQLGMTLYGSPLKYVLMLAPLAFVIYLSVRVYRMSAESAQIAFWLFAAVMGLSLSSIFLTFTGQSITQVFFVTAAAFAALSVWGYTTKKDLTGWGSFLIMGVVGLILASILNIFMGSGALSFAISALGVLIFAGLTAYDTQRIKDDYIQLSAMGDAAALGKSAILGALSLYLDFINMFTSLLNLTGSQE